MSLAYLSPVSLKAQLCRFLALWRCSACYLFSDIALKAPPLCPCLLPSLHLQLLHVSNNTTCNYIRYARHRMFKTINVIPKEPLHFLYSSISSLFYVIHASRINITKSYHPCKLIDSLYAVSFIRPVNKGIDINNKPFHAAYTYFHHTSSLRARTKARMLRN